MFVRLDDGPSVCVVHLTLEGLPNDIPQPRHRMFSTVEDWVRDVMVPDHEWYGR